MQVLFDEAGYITSFALVGTLVDGIELPEPADMEHFMEHFSAYRVRDGDLSFDAEQADLAKIYEIRQKRMAECFPIINRGQLWYDRLTDEQQQELNIWYQAWLDATITGAVPDKPAWL